MCTTCGCGEGDVRIDGKAAGHAHADGQGHSHPHEHGHDHGDGHHHHHHHDDGTLHYGRGTAGKAVPGWSQSRLVEIEIDVLSRNDALAAANRARLARARTLALNLVSSPGAGKTTLLVETLKRMAGESVAVIEGDQETANDADCIRAQGVPAVQINTGKGCHLDAQMVGQALDHLPAIENGVLFIENVGNLVCPAAFDLGEAHKVVIASVTEGEDKPLKYPGIFAVETLVQNARKVRPGIAVIRISAKTGEGFDDWLDWIESGRRMARLKG